MASWPLWGEDVPPNPARPVGEDDIICKSRKSVRRYYSYFWRGPAPAQTFQTATIITASPRHTSTSIIYVQVIAQTPPSGIAEVSGPERRGFAWADDRQTVLHAEAAPASFWKTP